MSKPRSLADQVYEQLRGDIVSGRIPSNEKLVELEIAEQTGTSQATVREALHRLDCDGLVSRQARRGTYVTEILSDAIRDYCAVCGVIEKFTICRAVKVVTDAQCDHLDSLIDKMTVAGQHGDIEALVQHDMRFHKSIGEWASSPVLLNAWIPLFLQIQRFIVQTHPKVFTPLSEMAAIHQPIVQALRARNQDAATQAIEEHVMLIWQQLDPGTTNGA